MIWCDVRLLSNHSKNELSEDKSDDDEIPDGREGEGGLLPHGWTQTTYQILNLLLEIQGWNKFP